MGFCDAQKVTNFIFGVNRVEPSKRKYQVECRKNQFDIQPDTGLFDIEKIPGEFFLR